MNRTTTEYTGEVEYDFPIGTELFPEILMEAYNEKTQTWRKVASKVILKIPKKESEDEVTLRLTVVEQLMG